MFTAGEVSKLSKVSVRTLHYYDEINLLKPAKVNKSGYRLYDDTSLKRLQSILMFKELKFSLKEIKTILDNKNVSFEEMLTHQIRLLELQKEHIEKLIILAKRIKKEGVRVMDFNAFDNEETNKYANEVKEKWGKTKEYTEYEEKVKGKNNEEISSSGEELMNIIAEISAIKTLPANNKKVQEKVAELQQYITDNFYTCSNEVLYGLGQMYVQDERFKKNIDKAGGEGTAEFVSKAIEFYCKENKNIKKG